jgi:hypothetical protein
LQDQLLSITGSVDDLDINLADPEAWVF